MELGSANAQGVCQVGDISRGIRPKGKAGDLRDVVLESHAVVCRQEKQMGTLCLGFTFDATVTSVVTTRSRVWLLCEPVAVVSGQQTVNIFKDGMGVGTTVSKGVDAYSAWRGWERCRFCDDPDIVLIPGY